ncbi:uncharacterized protein [Pagrus major]
MITTVPFNTPAPTDTTTPAPANTTTPAPTDTNTPAPANTTTPAPTDTTTPAPANTTTPAPTDTTTPAPTDTTTPAPANTTTPAPTLTTTPAPTDTNTPAPANTTTPAPANTTTPAPTNTTTPAPANTTTPAPTNTTTPAPTLTTTPAPANSTSPAPIDTTTPAPANSTSPAPIDTTTPAPTLTTTPAPTDTITPAPTTPTDATTPAPTNTTTPAPINTTTPAPTLTTTPAPTDTITPAPTTPTDATTPPPTNTTSPAPANNTSPAPIDTTTPAPTLTTNPAPTDTITPAPTTPTDATTPAPTNNTSPAPANSTSPAPTDTITPAPTTPTDATTPAPTNTTSPAPIDTTTPAPANSTSPAPIDTTTPAPANSTTPAPANSTSPAPIDTTTPAPTLTTTPAPTDTITPAPTTPTDATTPAPTNTTSPAPANSTSPAPIDTTTPAPTTPTDATTPAPTNTTSPAPANSTSPAPIDTTTPAPTLTTNPAPTDTITPAPTTPTDATTPAPTNTTSPAPANSTSPAPTDTITPAPTTPTDATTPAPTNTTSPAPANSTSLAPIDTTTPAPTDTTTPAPANTTTPAPTDIITPAPTTPTDATTPAPTNTTSPAPANSTSPAPTDTITPAPTTPTDATTPAPANSTSPAPIDTTTPAPTLTTNPAPTDTITPVPIDTTTPAPTLSTTPAPTDIITPAPTAPTDATTPAPPTTPPPTSPASPPAPTPPLTTPASTPAPLPPTAPTTTPPPTTTTPAPTPPPTPPLVCDNGGILLNGVCTCPDEWTGETCSRENFCRAQQLGGFNFPHTPIGWFAYSEEVCPTGTSGAGKPEASTRCSSINGSPSFEHKVQRLQCDQTLSDIQQNLTSPADLESLASSTQILTSQPEELTAENVTTAAQIVDRLLRSPNATESVRVAAVATVSQLLSAPDDSEDNNATLGLTETLDQLSVNLTLSLNTSQSQVVQPNLVVQSAQIPAADTQGVQFTSLSGTSGSFVADRIDLNTNTSTVVVENGFIADALIYVRFPPEAAGVRQKPSNVSLGFVLYQNDRFFRSRRYKRQRATIRVLSATVGGQERSMVPDHVEIMFRPRMVNGTSLYDFACVFWNYHVNDWSTDGCSKGNASDGLLRCFCNHTTNFAALWTFREKYEYAEALDWISIVGLSLSILGLVVTIGHHIKENFHINSGVRQNNKNSKIALLCIYVSLLAFIITFLSGVQNSSRQNDAQVEVDAATNTVPDSDERVEPDRGSCSAVAALLHFFLLATFMWSSVYSTQLVLLVRTMRSSLPPYWSKLSHAVGWGLPAVLMAITLGATYRVDSPLGYRQEEFCWLAALDKNKQFHFGKPMFWAFLLPVALILIYNIVLLVLTSLATCRTDPNLKSTNPSSLRKNFLISFSLAVLLGLSWTMGYLVLVTSGTPHLVFSIVFCLCTTTQGFQIFILFTARTPSFRASVSRPVQYISSINMHLNNRTYSLTKNLWSTSGSESYRDIKDQQESEV